MMTSKLKHRRREGSGRSRNANVTKLQINVTNARWLFVGNAQTRHIKSDLQKLYTNQFKIRTMKVIVESIFYKEIIVSMIAGNYNEVEFCIYFILVSVFELNYYRLLYY